MLSGEKILITGVTGMVPLPIAEFLAGQNEVWGVARFTNREARSRLESLGVTTRAIDLAGGDLSPLPGDFSYVIHCAHTRMGAGQFVPAIQVNAVGAGRVLQHCRRARAALVVSSGAVYSPRNDDVFYAFKEDDDIGRAYAPWAPTSPVSKVSLEAVARFCAEGFALRTTIVRLNVVYGPLGGMPVFDMQRVAAGQPVATFADPYPSNPIHADDICEQVEPLLDAASVPATIVNWCGDEVVTQRQWCERAGQLASQPAKLEVTPIPGAPCGSVGDAERRRSLTGPCRRRFWEAFDALYRARFPGGSH
jgi:nucleoside-diphosphate-sugar epimerase